MKTLTILKAVLLAVTVLSSGSWLPTPAFATFCQISNISYNYPQQVLPAQTFTTAVTVTGVCAPDDANYYSIRVDLNEMSGRVLSDVSVPIGFSQGHTWTFTVQNEATASSSPTRWQILFAVYIFAAVASGGIMDSATFKQVTIQVETQQAQITTSSFLTSQETSVIMTSTTAPTSTISSTQNYGVAQPSTEMYRWIAAVLVIILLMLTSVSIRQKQRQHTAFRRGKDYG